MNEIINFIRDEDGAALIEYGLIAALVAVAAIAGLTVLGSKLSSLFTSVGSKLSVSIT